MRVRFPRLDGALAAPALVAVLALAGCAQYQATQRTDGLPLAVATEPPPRPTTAAPPPAPQAKPRITSIKKDSGPKVAAAKPPTAYQRAGAADAMDEASCTDVFACASVLKAMIADPRRSWMKEPAPAAVLVNGVRLFAYRALRENLACHELATAATEVEAATTAFRWGVAGVTAEQADRARTLSAEVGQELHDEGARRCAPGSKVGMVQRRMAHAADTSAPELQ